MSSLAFTPNRWEQDLLWELKQDWNRKEEVWITVATSLTVLSYSSFLLTILKTHGLLVFCLVPSISQQQPPLEWTPKFLFLFGLQSFVLVCICAFYFPSNTSSAPNLAQLRNGWGWQEWKAVEAVPISIPRAAIRVLNSLTSHLESAYLRAEM